MEITNLAQKTEDFTGNVWKIKNNGKTSLIDAGEGDCWNQIKKQKQIDQVIITHSHHDHIKNLPKINEKYSAEVYAYKPKNIPVKAEKLENGQKIEIAEMPFKVIHTPGHKNDSICLYQPENKILFTGDLIFSNGKFGRTDLEEGKRDKLIKSIQKITELNIKEFYPGHGQPVQKDANKWIKKSLKEAKKHEPKY